MKYIRHYQSCKILAAALLVTFSSASLALAQCGGETPVKCHGGRGTQSEGTFRCCSQESFCATHPNNGEALCAPRLNSYQDYLQCKENAERNFQACISDEDGQVAYILCQFILSREPERDRNTIPACVEADRILGPCIDAYNVAVTLCEAGASDIDIEAEIPPSLPPGFGQPKSDPPKDEPNPDRPRFSVPPELIPFTA